jgi:hypothetical protein
VIVIRHPLALVAAVMVYSWAMGTPVMGGYHNDEGRA